MADLETMYGSEAVAQAITYCNANKKQAFLSLKYVITVLNSWQAEGALGQHSTNGNGKVTAPEPKYRIVENGVGPDGKPIMRREVIQ